MYFKPQLAFHVGIPYFELDVDQDAMRKHLLAKKKKKLNKFNGLAPFCLFLLKRRGGVC